MRIITIRIVAEAWIWLAIARMMLLVIPFRKLMPLLGKKATPMYAPVYSSDNRLRRIGNAIIKAGHWSPWRTRCFEQALAAKLMLKCRGMVSTVFFGVSKGDGRMNAHAWLESSGVTVTGDKHLEQYSVIACFKS